MNRSPTQYDFHVGAKTIRYSVNTAQLLILLISGGSRHSDKGGGEGDGHPDPEIKGMPGLQKHFFFFGPSGLSLDPSPRFATANGGRILVKVSMLVHKKW